MKITHRALFPSRGALIGPGFRVPHSVRGRLESRSPADLDDVLGSFAYGSDDVEEAVEAAREAVPVWSAQRIEDRGHALRRFQEQLQQHSGDLVIRLERETGRPHWECVREVRSLINRIEHTVAIGRVVLEKRIDGTGPVNSRPWGVVAVIGPAMLPLSTSHQHIVAGLLAGNAVIWKPSPLCPASAQLYAEALAGSGMPSGAINMIQGGDDVGADLAAHPGVDCVVFTGTLENGKALRRASEERLEQKQIYHLGAKNPAVVIGDGPIEMAAYEVAVSAFLSAGQRCTAVSRVYVERSGLDEFMTKLLAVCQRAKIGPPRSDAFYGPMLSEARMERFQAAIAAAPACGAQLVLESQRLDLPGYYLSPSVHVIHDDHTGAPYLDDELFGPDLAVHGVDNFNEALDLCNRSRYGLCAVLFADRYKAWERFTREVKAGTLMLNSGTHAMSGRMPFGGIKASGQGGRAGSDAILALRREVSCQERQSTTIDLFPGTQPPDEPAPPDEPDGPDAEDTVDEA